MRHRSQIWTRYALAALAFTMALVLTPRALLDVTEPAGSQEVPVDMLDPADECLWCSESPQIDDDSDCDDIDIPERPWMEPREISDFDGAGCPDVAAEPSA